MSVLSIVMFVITFSMLVYSGLVFLNKKIILPINKTASVKKVSKEYVKRFGFLIMFLSIAPFISGILGFITTIIFIPIIVFFVLFVILLVVGIKIIMKQ